MDGDGQSELERDVAGAIAWWREAGVDLCFDDEPARWISPSQATALEAERLRVELREAVPSDGGRQGGTPDQHLPQRRADSIDLAGMPDDLAGYVQWWLADPSLDGGRAGGRVPPRGPAGAPLMVLVPEPEADDIDRLLSGPQGRLLGAIVGALGLSENSIYLASALPRHMPIPDWPDLAAIGFGETLSRHVALAAPQRILAFGTGVLSLLSHGRAKSAANPNVFTHAGLHVPVFPARSLEALLARPAWKAEFWNGLLDWMPAIPDRTSGKAEA